MCIYTILYMYIYLYIVCIYLKYIYKNSKHNSSKPNPCSFKSDIAILTGICILFLMNAKTSEYSYFVYPHLNVTVLCLSL